MNVQLSRRVAVLTNRPSIRLLSSKDYQGFIDAVESAASFDTLPEQWKKCILTAEKEQPQDLTLEEIMNSFSDDNSNEDS